LQCLTSSARPPSARLSTKVRGLFVTGTDTDAGKTVVSAALLAAMAAAGEQVRAHKPVVTGLGEHGDGSGALAWPADHELLGATAGMDPELVAPLRYGPAVSPHLAAELAGEQISPARLIACARRAVGEAAGGTLIVEGVGGLLTPLAHEHTVCDFAVALGLPLLIAARPGLGTINHTLLTLHLARAAELQVQAVVLTPWPQDPSRMERSNRSTIARLGEVRVATLAYVHSPEPGALADAGVGLLREMGLPARSYETPARAAATTAAVTASRSSSLIT